ncbi:MAG: polyprenyl synthetase family protein [Peptoniphilaceae bacterium]|nr:polyprenyl synthetase family protein [Peptoniphilaceae bacterium]MDY6019391.1 polyprenyl synthetase family protein [Anaerococcus sp.]
MTKEDFLKLLADDKKIIDKRIEEFFSKQENRLDQAVYYAIDGGKRIRPIVFLETIKMLRGQDFNLIDLDLAISLEMIHAYSLIHDDMPSMDNDDFRRGKETVHKKYGESIALLAGDYLLNTAYENIFKQAINDLNIGKAGYYMAKCAGKNGMIDGQYYDIFKKTSYDLSYVLKVYEKKTAGLFMAALVAAGLSLGKDCDTILKLKTYGKYLGLSFQLQDDLLETETEDELNILNVISKDKAKEYLAKFNQEAKEAVKNFDKNDFHVFLIDYLSTRTN